MQVGPVSSQESVANDFEPVFAIVPEGCNSLGLVHEALQQLHPRMHWKVSFSTYFARSSGAECHWRFLRKEWKKRLPFEVVRSAS